MTENVLFSSIPPIPCCSCMRVRREHSQYTRDTYFWHSKVMAERQAFNLCAAFGEKGMLVYIYVYYFPKEWEGISVNAESRMVLCFLLYVTSAKNKARLFPREAHGSTVLGFYSHHVLLDIPGLIAPSIRMISTCSCSIWDPLVMSLCLCLCQGKGCRKRSSCICCLY